VPFSGTIEKIVPARLLTGKGVPITPVIAEIASKDLSDSWSE
jgi:Na+-translocating ferredoxin:NAD+ oxidoreductase RnfC subunit